MATLKIFLLCVAFFSVIQYLAESIEQRATIRDNKQLQERSAYNPLLLRPIWWAAITVVSVCGVSAFC